MRAGLIAATGAALLLAACDRGPPEEPRVAVDEAWVRLPPVANRPGAAYFTLRSNDDRTRLVGITSPQVQRIELHDSRAENGTIRMAPLEPGELAFPNGTLVFEPGGKHAMLIGIDPAVEPGDRIELNFDFEPAPDVTVEAEVRGPTGERAHEAP